MTTDPLIGMVLDGRFHVVREIGSGAMGSVYEARSRSGRQIAVKFLHRHLARNEESKARFERESTAAAQIDSPYVAKVLGAGIQVDDRSGIDYPYICFELLRGETIAQRLRAVERLPIQTVARIIDNVLEGLSVAHRILVHRDIKPANIILTPDGFAEKAVILDFGISKLRGQPGLTKVESTLGSVAYMPPEQIDDATRVDESADLYAVGVVAYEALTGSLPFSGSTTLQVEQFKRRRRAQTLASRMGDAWGSHLQSVDGLLSRLMSRSPLERYRSAAEALEAWRTACEEITFH